MAQVRNEDKQAIRELLDEWLARFGATPTDGYERKLVVEAVNFFTGSGYHQGSVNFAPGSFFDWHCQELIAFIAEFFLELRGVYDITDEMAERILMLKDLVNEHNIPLKLVRSR